uniref:Uncharacterized protein n=1 Tax=Neogobius melanostomus TaxID=47308 RepID=A0A8C6TP52_9GOBI
MEPSGTGYYVVCRPLATVSCLIISGHRPHTNPCLILHFPALPLSNSLCPRAMYDHIPGPPRDSFIFGHIGTFMKLTRDDDKLIFDQFLKWSEKYGPVYRLNFLHTVIICVTCPHATKVNWTGACAKFIHSCSCLFVNCAVF